MIYKTVDLCAGIGGIRRGFELTGQFENILSAEIDEQACRTYQHLYGDDPRNDLTSWDFKYKLESLEYDAILAGFPCQTFSSAGLQMGFRDTTKGTIFFDIAEMIQRTQPKFVFLENVENLVRHDHGRTFRTILNILDKELNYKVIGVRHNDDGTIDYNAKDFVRNSKNFGVPQNRPRVYIVAFSRRYYGEHLDNLINNTPEIADGEPIYGDVNDVLDAEVPIRYFMSEGYLQTLEKHRKRQLSKGNGYGMKIVNDPSIEHPIATTLMATGGSGKERNLVIDESNGKRYAGMTAPYKQTPINDRFIRMMTPNEWGKLQGFVNYAFIEDGIDRFSFPESVSDFNKYKQFGNSVTIPVIRTMAQYICNCIDQMTAEFSQIEQLLYTLRGKDFLMCHELYRVLGRKVRDNTYMQYVDAYQHFHLNTPFRAMEFSDALGCIQPRAAQMLAQLTDVGAVEKTGRGLYMFTEDFIKGIMRGDTRHMCQ